MFKYSILSKFELKTSIKKNCAVYFCQLIKDYLKLEKSLYE